MTLFEFPDKWSPESREIIGRAITGMLSDHDVDRICKIENITRGGLNRRIAKVRLCFAGHLRKCLKDLGEDEAFLLSDSSMKLNLLDGRED